MLEEFAIFGNRKIPVKIGEFWTARQRAGHSLHEISYRACYKPQLPEHFIRRHTKPGDTVFDPFLGRGTTLIEAALLGRRVAGSDINPLSRLLTAPRLHPPPLDKIRERIGAVPLDTGTITNEELLVFFHPQTLLEIESWRSWFKKRRADSAFDPVDAWLEMVCLNRLTGHSPGFFSVYTMPPNQAVSVQSQRVINAKRNQTPPLRDTRAILWKKSRSLLSDPLPQNFGASDALVFTASADSLDALDSCTVDLVVTSPPFLNEVDYLADNWMRMWFAGVSVAADTFWKLSSLQEWKEKMHATFLELLRVVKPGGIVAFEVGEVRKGKIALENEVLETGARAGFEPLEILINSQEFTKTSNCWGIDNNQCGTNSNRIVLFRKSL